jgi:hypothetical protein
MRTATFFVTVPATMKDKGVFAPAGVGVLIGIASLATLSEGMSPAESIIHVGIGIVGFVMAVAAFGFAMRWNAPPAPQPEAPRMSGTTASPTATATNSGDDHLHSTLGTGGVSGEMSASRLGSEVSSGAALDSAGSDASDSGGNDSGGSDYGGGSGGL